MSIDRLRNDERGAVMIIGLIMAFALIGALWFLLGIGATIVFREKMQLAADTAAFSAAAVHARDMNIIVAFNLVMFILTGVWLILCITYTVAEVSAAYMTVVGVVSCIVGCEALPEAAAADDLASAVGEMKDTYSNILGKVLPVLSEAQDVIAEGADIEAAGLTAMDIAFRSHGDVIGLGASADDPQPQAMGQIGKRLGLPIENEKNSALCNHASQWILSYLEDLLRKSPLIGDLMGMSDLKKLALKASVSSIPVLKVALEVVFDGLDEIRNVTSKGLTVLYCSGGVWDKAGPKRMFRSDPNDKSKMEKNASDYMQVWGLAITPNGFDDNDAERKIGIASRTERTHTDPPAYDTFKYAQAEYYFDCSGTWASGDCNAVTDTVHDSGIDAAMYRMEWRARLVRVHTPKNMPGGQIIKVVGSILHERAVLKQAESSGPYAPVVSKALGELPSSVLDFINALPAGNFH